MLMYNICEEILSVNRQLEGIPMQTWRALTATGV